MTFRKKGSLLTKKEEEETVNIFNLTTQRRRYGVLERACEVKAIKTGRKLEEKKILCVSVYGVVRGGSFARHNPHKPGS